MSTNASSSPSLTANYTSPDNATFNFEHDLPRIESSTPKDRAIYLGALRGAALKLQETINMELTQRMEEDNAKSNGAIKNGKVDEAKEEENYGEEVVDDE